MSYTLIAKQNCPFCWQVKLALAYRGIDYTLQESSKPEKELLLRYSPQATSPILLINEFAIWDSNAIVNYIDDLAVASPSLLPGNAEQRAQARLIQQYSNSIVGQSLREVIFEKRDKAEADWDLQRIEAGRRGWQQCLDWLEQQIEAEQSFLKGGFSLADVALLPRFGLAEYYGEGVSMQHKKLSLWFEQMKQTDAYQSTLPY